MNSTNLRWLAGLAALLLLAFRSAAPAQSQLHLVGYSAMLEKTDLSKPEREQQQRLALGCPADYHRNLFTGGICLYPPTTAKPGGKRRLLYECYPLAYLIEQAAGQAVTEAGVVLDVPSTADLHQRAPLFVGSAELLRELLAVAAR